MNSKRPSRIEPRKVRVAMHVRSSVLAEQPTVNWRICIRTELYLEMKAHTLAHQKIDVGYLCNAEMTQC